MIKKLIALSTVLILVSAQSLSAHCEIPCGIYTDDMRVKMIREDCQTILKSMKQIETLSEASSINYNQLVRWVNNKETHANKIQEVVTQYYMTQRIKPSQANYSEKLEHLHAMLLSAMKCKQTTDPAHVEALEEHLDAFVALYFDKEKAKHLLEHHDGSE